MARRAYRDPTADKAVRNLTTKTRTSKSRAFYLTNINLPQIEIGKAEMLALIELCEFRRDTRPGRDDRLIGRLRKEKPNA